MLSNSHDEYQFKYHQIRIPPIIYSIFSFFALLPINQYSSKPSHSIVP